MIGNVDEIVPIVEGVDVTGGLMQLREEITMPEVTGSYVNSCVRVYQDYSVHDAYLRRLSLVEGRRAVEEGFNYTAAQVGFYMGGVIGLRTVECGSDESLVQDMHRYLQTKKHHEEESELPKLSPNELYLQQLTGMASLADEGVEHVRAVELPYKDWADQLYITEPYYPSFMMGIAVMAMLGHQAGEKRAQQLVDKLFKEHASEW